MNWCKYCRVNIWDLVLDGTAVALLDAAIHGIASKEITAVFL